MKLRRCAVLFVELDHEPRFEFTRLLQGGDGLVRTPRWRALAPHLPEPVTVTLAQLALLEALPHDEWVDAIELQARHAAAELAALQAVGLLLCDPPQDAQWRGRDDAAREVAWWTPALVAQAQGRWSGVDIQAQNERGLMLDAREMVEAFGAAPEPDYRRTPQALPQPLAPPRRSEFDALLAARRTCRNFEGEAVLDAGRFATMMRRVWGAVGTRELAPGAVAVKKTSPAGGGLHAVEAYLLVQRVEGVAPGLYHYLAMDHSLECLRPLAAAEAAKLAHQFVAGQNWFGNVPVMVIMTARFERVFWKYRRHTKAWRVLHLDVGHLSQTMYLSAAELGLGCFVTAAINDSQVDAALDLAPLREAAIAVVGFGARSDVLTTMELDPVLPVVPAHLV